jgi:hypothetical protein
MLETKIPNNQGFVYFFDFLATDILRETYVKSLCDITPATIA